MADQSVTREPTRLKGESGLIQSSAPLARAEAEAHPGAAAEAIKRRNASGETLADIARTYNVGRNTISRLPSLGDSHV